MPSPDPGFAARVSCIVRTKNSSATLARCLESLRAQALPPAEIILVDNGSTDDSKQIGASYGAVVIDYPREKPFNHASAINLGIRASRGEFLWIVSSHVIVPSRETLGALLETMKNPAVAGAYCVHERLAASRPPGAPLTERIGMENFSGLNGLHNYCSLIRRKIWAGHPFDETIATVEDQAWALWCYRQRGLFTVGIYDHPVGYFNARDSVWKSVRERAITALLIAPKRPIIRSAFGFLRRGLIDLLHGKAASALAHIWTVILILHAVLWGLLNKKPRWLVIT